MDYYQSVENWKAEYIYEIARKNLNKFSVLEDTSFQL